MKIDRKKIVVFFVSVLLMMGLMFAILGYVFVVKNTENTEEIEEIEDSVLTVTAYASRSQLMNVFQPKGDNSTIGKIVFGKDSGGNPLEWYILGKDAAVGDGKNISVFSASPIIEDIQFGDASYSNKIFEENYGEYWIHPKEVYPNHYGASDLRVLLQSLATNTDYFSIAEQSLMQETTITTYDTYNKKNYKTTDVLYALHGEYTGFHADNTVYAGTNDDKVLPINVYLTDSKRKWLKLRTAAAGRNSYICTEVIGDYIFLADIDTTATMQPASNINLSSVLFASAAKAATSDTVVGIISDGDAMTLRLEGSNADLGSVIYCLGTGDIIVEKGNAADTVSLVVQGDNGTYDWYYSKVVSADSTLNVTDIMSTLAAYGISDVDLSKCKMWMEKTDKNGLLYAVNAVEGTVPLMD